MRTRDHLLGILVTLGMVTALLGFGLLFGAERAVGQSASSWSVTGRLIDPQGQPVSAATVRVYVDGDDEPIEAETHDDGTYLIDLPRRPERSLRIEVERSHFRPVEYELDVSGMVPDEEYNALRAPDLTMERKITAGFWIATAAFVLMLTLIALEVLHSTVAALLGAAIMFAATTLGYVLKADGLIVLSMERALSYIDFEVIFLVMGMMIVIGIIEDTGVFQWLAFVSYRVSRGRAWLLVIVLMLITGVASALLDNVTTMLLMTPISLQIAIAMGINPLSFLIPEVLASNIAGISTLIGTPTNILIGSYAGITFDDFLINQTVGVVLALIVLIVYTEIVYRKEYRAASGGVSGVLYEKMRQNARIKDPSALRKSLIIFGVMIVFFVAGEGLHTPPAITAMVGATALLIWVEPDVEKMLKAVDWTTLVFFMALFMVVGAIQEVGLVSYIATFLADLVGDSLVTGLLILVWFGAILSAIIDNIPFAAAMLPVVGYLTQTIPGAESKVLFYGLSVGAAMGGNGSLIGSSANVVTAGIAERAGYPITYVRFMKIGVPAMFLTTGAATLWLLLRFFVLG